MDNLKIGQFIKELRLKNKLTQTELSEKVHVTRQAVSNWETGKAVPDSSMLLDLSKLFNVSVDEILLGTSERNEDDFQQLALNLIDYNIEKNNKIKRLLKTIVYIVVMFIITFLLYFFVTTYNSTRVYVLSGSSKDYLVRDGILIKTNQKIYIKNGEITNSDKIDEIKLYYVDKNNKKRIIYNGHNTNSLIVKNFKYEDEMNKGFNNLKNNLYLEIKYEKKSYTIKLKVRESFKNSGILNNKRQVKEVEDNTENDLVEESTINEKLEPTVEINEENNQKEKVEIKEETIDTNTVEEETIDYNQVINLIKQKGTNQFNSYVVEYIDGETFVNISLIENILTIETLRGNVSKLWELNIKDSQPMYASYLELENMVENKKCEIYFSNNNEYNEYINEMNKILYNFVKSNL